jgi:hypothetical protein
MKQRDILTEKRKVKSYFMARTFFLFSLVSIYGLLVCLYLFTSTPGYPEWDKKVQETILPVLPAVLVFIASFIFVIPETAGVKEFPGYKRAIMVIYLFWSTINIAFTFFLLLGIIPLSVTVFKLCIVFLVSTLFFPISYAFFAHSHIYDALIRLFNFSARHFVRGSKPINQQTYEKINERISSMGRLTIHALHEYDENTFCAGLKKISSLAKIMMESSTLDPKFLNGFFKNVIINYRRIASECIKSKLENYLRETFSSITDLIKYGMTCKNNLTSKINYPIAVNEMKKVGLMSIESNMLPVGSEIIDSLAQIGDMSLSRHLDHPPAIEIVTALQEIGTEYANRRLENLCLEILIKIEFFGIGVLNDIDSCTDSDREKEMGKVFKSTLKSHWIVSAFLFKNIPESEEWLREAQVRMRGVFENYYIAAYSLALKKMHLTSYVGKKILSDYFNALRKNSYIA